MSDPQIIRGIQPGLPTDPQGPQQPQRFDPFGPLRIDPAVAAQPPEEWTLEQEMDFALEQNRQRRRRELAIVLNDAVKSDPDLVGEAQRLGIEIGVDPGVAERNLDKVRQLVRAKQLEKEDLAVRVPFLARQLRDPNFARLAHDDIDNLSTWERIKGTWDAAHLQVQRGRIGERMRMGLATDQEIADMGAINRRLGELPGVDGFLTGVTQILAYQHASLTETLAGASLGGIAGAGFALAAGQAGPQVAVPEELATVPTAFATGAFTGATLARMRFSYQVEAGNHYLDMLEQGLDRDAASSAAVWVGYVNSLLELGGTAAIAKGAGLGVKSIRQAFGKELAKETALALQKQTKGSALKKFLVGYAAGAGGEVATEVLQEVSNVLGEEYVRGESGRESQFATPEGRAAVAQRLAGIARDTMYGMAVLGFPGPAFALRRDVLRVREAERTAAFLDRAVKNANESKVAERNPSLWEEHMANSLDGHSAEYVHIEAAKFDEVLHQVELTYEDLAKLDPKLAREVRQIARSGGDVVTKTATLLAKFRNTPILEALKPHMRFKADQMSMDDALKGRAQFQTLVSNLVAQLEPQRMEEAKWTASQQAVAESMRRQLVATGKLPGSSVASDTARLYAAMVGELARAADMTPEQFEQKHGVKVRVVDDKVPTQDAGAAPERAASAADLPSSDRSAEPAAQPAPLDPGTTAAATEPATPRTGEAPAVEGLDQSASIDQQGGQEGFRSGDRGSYDPERLEILLRKQAQLTTVLHEMAHWYLDILGDLAADPSASARAGSDMRRILDWFGIKDVATWRAMTLQQQKQYHELFAYSFERYLFQGQAPSDGLRAVFSRVAAWFRKVYSRTVDQINAGYFKATGQTLPALTPEVRAIFDRMLASEEQITVAAEIEGMTKVFESQAEAAGVSDEQWKAYSDLQQDAIRSAIDENTAQNIEHLEWLASRRAEEVGALKKQADAAREKLRLEVEAETSQLPVYRALRWLQTGEIAGEEMPAGQVHKLSSEVVASLAPEGTDLRKLTGKKGILAKEGVHPDLVAPTFGFESGRDLVAAILAAKPFNAAVDIETDTRMLADNPELADIEARQRAISKALHNELRARVLTSELQMLEQVGSPAKVRAAAKEAAARIISRTTVSGLDPQQYAANEARAAKRAKEAIKQGDKAAAILAQRQRLLQHELFLAAVAADDARAETIAYMERFYEAEKNVAKTRDIDFVLAGRKLAASYRFGPAMDRNQDLQKVNDALARLRADSTYAGLVATLERMLTDQADGQRSFVDLTVDELRGLRDLAENLWNEAYNAKRILIEGRRAEVKEIAGSLQARLEALPQRKAPGVNRPEKSTPSPVARETMQFWNSAALWKRFVHVVRLLDQGESGPWRRYLLDPVEKALQTFQKERDLLVDTFAKQIRPLAEAMGASWDAPIVAKELGGFRFRGKRELLGAILHSGTESNLRKLLVPYGWADDPRLTDDLLDTSKWDRFLARMFDEGVLTEADMQFVQFVWDTYKKQLPAQQKAHKELFGYEFDTIELRPVRTPWGTLEGGYVPAYTDRDAADPRVGDRRVKALEGIEGEGQAFQYSVSTGRGHTMARSPFYMQRLHLDVTKQLGHMVQQMRFAHVQPAIRNATRILRDFDLTAALNRYDRELLNGTIMPFLEAAATQTSGRASQSPFLDKMQTALRRSATMVALGWNLLNSMAQLTGLSNSRQMVKGRWLRAGLQTLSKNPAAAFRYAHERSELMRQRWDQDAEQLRDEVARLSDTWLPFAQDAQRNLSRAQKAAARMAFLPQRILQGAVDVMTWHGAYQQSLAESRADGSITLEEAEAEAARVADLTVIRTQGSTNPEHLADIERSTPGVKLMLAFTGYANTVLNQWMAAGPGWGPRLRASLWVLVVPALVENTLRLLIQGAPEDEEGDGIEDEIFGSYMRGLVRNTTALAPILGPMALTAFESEGARVMESPAAPVVRALFQSAFAAAKPLTDEEATATDVRRLGVALTVLTGFPLHPISRAIAYDMDVGSGKARPDDGLEYARGLVLGR